ncbi:MAG: UDP-3-O-acyl-N-acetylglucosamine deacetylase [Planctomycetaceae bacterium]|nr:MAG: UDP-3-O-acyl-N-acetylglucosamine deacetylase [Planctomycetaceae bacterium]
MRSRSQQTLSRPVEIQGTALFRGCEVRVSLLPAPEHHGIVFQRVDLPGRPLIPADVDYVVEAERRTVLMRDGARVEVTEHLLAALAGLQIDNCLVQLNAPELPHGEGNCLHYVRPLLEAGFQTQSAMRSYVQVNQTFHARDAQGAEINIGPAARPTLVITYELDYGPRAPIKPQWVTYVHTPEDFITHLAFARTYALQEEAEAMRQRGYGVWCTPRDVLIFGPDGVWDNTLYTYDECARHKILDCLGDLALLGCDLEGHVRASRSGHALNHQLGRALRRYQQQDASPIQLGVKTTLPWRQAA